MHGLLIGAVVLAALTIGTLSVVPLPGIAGCNVQVTVGATEFSFIVGTYFAINSVSATVTGPATLLDWGAWLSVAPPALFATYSMTVTIAGHASTQSSSQLFPSVPVVNGAQLTATDTFNLGQIPQGQQGIGVSLSQSGNVVATGSGSVNVGC